MTSQPPPIDLWFETDRFGVIVNFAPDALMLIGYSARTARGRPLPVMFSKGRPQFSDLEHAWRGYPVERDGTILPRDRAGVRVRYRIELTTAADELALRWTVGRL